MEESIAKASKAVRQRRLAIRRLKSSEPNNVNMPLSSSSSSSSKGTEQDTTNNSSNTNSNSFSSSLYSPPSPFSSSTFSPELDSTAVVGSCHGWKCSAHGSVCLIGKRREMEDAVTVAPGFSPEYDFFGVYDGHGGKEVAVACRERMHVVLAGEVQRRGVVGAAEMGWREVMEECFMKVDGEVLGRAKEGSAAEKTVGSTAVVAVVGMDRIVVANCGDSRAVLCRGGVAVPLSSDHKPNRPDELERVEAAGGRVIDWDGSRVLGVLATSRSIGDEYLKPFVTSEPEVTVTERTQRDEFLVLASDGLWDVVSSETACYLTRKCLKGWMAAVPPECSSSRGASAAAAALAELALSRGSRDNISVVVVVL